MNDQIAFGISQVDIEPWPNVGSVYNPSAVLVKNDPPIISGATLSFPIFFF